LGIHGGNGLGLLELFHNLELVEGDDVRIFLLLPRLVALVVAMLRHGYRHSRRLSTLDQRCWSKPAASVAAGPLYVRFAARSENSTYCRASPGGLQSHSDLGELGKLCGARSGRTNATTGIRGVDGLIAGAHPSLAWPLARLESRPESKPP